MSGFAGRAVSVATTQVFCCRMKAAMYINEWIRLRLNKTLLTKASNGPDLQFANPCSKQQWKVIFNNSQNLLNTNCKTSTGSLMWFV